jgi:Fe(3+) dicitrate transport protein
MGLSVAASPALTSWAQGPGSPARPGSDSDVVVISGILPLDLDLLAGSGLVIDQSRLEAMNPLTAKEALRLAPGVAVVEEDALGLKLNVSVRGLNPRRSSRTLLMEDGVPIQPAPYADPSAHYYPPLDRVDRIEIRRGSGQISYGPQSVGGMINFVTRAAPRKPMARVRIEVGERGFRSAHVAIGSGDDSFGAGVFLTGKSINGIRDGHGTEVTDAVLRMRLDLAESHSLDFKLAQYDESTGLTEGGLNQARFDISPYYNPFGDDHFDLERTSAQLSHL